jgi:hypothetical protein
MLIDRPKSKRGRPIKVAVQTIQLSTWLPKEVADTLRGEAARKCVTVSDLVRSILAAHIGPF